MNIDIADMRECVVNLLENHSKRRQQIALLHYETQHGTRISPEEMIGSMSLGRSDRIGVDGKGQISNQTMYIALNYQEQMNRMNTEAASEIAQRLLELEAEQDRLRYYVSLLEKREADVIRLTYFEGLHQGSAATSVGIVTRTMRRIEKLAEMYTFAENSWK